MSGTRFFPNRFGMDRGFDHCSRTWGMMGGGFGLRVAAGQISWRTSGSSST